MGKIIDKIEKRKRNQNRKKKQKKVKDGVQMIYFLTSHRKTILLRGRHIGKVRVESTRTHTIFTQIPLPLEVHEGNMP